MVSWSQAMWDKIGIRSLAQRHTNQAIGLRSDITTARIVTRRGYYEFFSVTASRLPCCLISGRFSCVATRIRSLVKALRSLSFSS